MVNGTEPGRSQATFGVLLAASWCAGAFLVLHLGIGLLVQVAPGAARDILSVGAVQLLVVGGASYGLMATYGAHAARTGRGREFSRFFALDRTPARTIALGALLGLGIKLPADGVRALTERLFPTPDVTLAAQAELLRHETPAQTVALLLVIGVLAPCVEELFYRGAIYRLLARSRGVLTASAFTLLAFALSHAAARDWPALLIVAFVLTFLRARSGSLWPSIAAHIVFNSATLLALFTGRSEVLDPFQVGPWGVVSGVLLSVALLAWLRADSAGGGQHA